MKVLSYLKPLLLGAGIAMFAAGSASAQEQVVVVGWGGVWQDAYRKALFEPFMKETGIKIIEEEFGGEYAKITSQVAVAPTACMGPVPAVVKIPTLKAKALA